MNSVHSRPIRAVLALCIAISLALIASPVASAAKKAAPADKTCAITVNPISAVNNINTNHTVLVSVTTRTGPGKGRGPCVPAANVTVPVRILAGPNVGLTALLTTNAAGQAAYTWTSPRVGVDVVRFKAGGKTTVALKYWVDPNPYGEAPKTKGVFFNKAGINSASLYVTRNCYNHNFTLFPAYDSSTNFVSASLTIDGKLYKTTSAQFEGISVNIKKFKKGTHTFELTATFSVGNPVTITGKFTRCG